MISPMGNFCPRGTGGKEALRPKVGVAGFPGSEWGAGSAEPPRPVLEVLRGSLVKLLAVPPPHAGPRKPSRGAGHVSGTCDHFHVQGRSLSANPDGQDAEGELERDVHEPGLWDVLCDKAGGPVPRSRLAQCPPDS